MSKLGKIKQYLSDKCKEARENGFAWISYEGYRYRIVPPETFPDDYYYEGSCLQLPRLEMACYCEGKKPKHWGTYGFVKGRGSIRLASVWWHGTGDRMHVNLGPQISDPKTPKTGTFFRTDDKNLLAIVTECQPINGS